MNDILERVTITNFKGKIKENVKDPNIEFVITYSGKPIGVYMGVSAWEAMQNTLSLFRNNPESLLKSLEMHHRFQKLGKAEGHSLRDFELLLKQEKLKD